MLNRGKLFKNGVETVVAQGGDLMYPLGYTLRATDIFTEQLKNL